MKFFRAFKKFINVTVAAVVIVVFSQSIASAQVTDTKLSQTNDGRMVIWLNNRWEFLDQKPLGAQYRITWVDTAMVQGLPVGTYKHIGGARLEPIAAPAPVVRGKFVPKPKARPAPAQITITMHTVAGCPPCIASKNLLNSNGIPFTPITGGSPTGLHPYFFFNDGRGGQTTLNRGLTQTDIDDIKAGRLPRD